MKSFYCLVMVLALGLGAFAQEKGAKPPKDPEFQDLYIATFADGQTKEIPSFLRFEKEQFVVSPMKPVKKDQPDPTVQWRYDTIAAADFIIDKQSTEAATLLLGAGLAGSGGLGHFLTVKTKAGDYIILHLGLDTYRFILAELEKRAKIKVAIAGAKGRPLPATLVRRLQKPSDRQLASSNWKQPAAAAAPCEDSE